MHSISASQGNLHPTEAGDFLWWKKPREWRTVVPVFWGQLWLEVVYWLSLFLSNLGNGKDRHYSDSLALLDFSVDWSTFHKWTSLQFSLPLGQVSGSLHLVVLFREAETQSIQCYLSMRHPEGVLPSTLAAPIKRLLDEVFESLLIWNSWAVGSDHQAQILGT